LARRQAGGPNRAPYPLPVVKKVRVSYYTDAYARWELENLGQVKISLEGIPLQEPAPAAAG